MGDILDEVEGFLAKHTCGDKATLAGDTVPTYELVLAIGLLERLLDRHKERLRDLTRERRIKAQDAIAWHEMAIRRAQRCRDQEACIEELHNELAELRGEHMAHDEHLHAQVERLERELSSALDGMSQARQEIDCLERELAGTRHDWR